MQSNKHANALQQKCTSNANQRSVHCKKNTTTHELNELNPVCHCTVRVMLYNQLLQQQQPKRKQCQVDGNKIINLILLVTILFLHSITSSSSSVAAFVVRRASSSTIQHHHRLTQAKTFRFMQTFYQESSNDGDDDEGDLDKWERMYQSGKT
eukprot:10753969-Ditylum_brightwellii.AAC.1